MIYDIGVVFAVLPLLHCCSSVAVVVVVVVVALLLQVR